MRLSCTLAVMMLLAAVKDAQLNNQTSFKNEPSSERFNFFDIELLQEIGKAVEGNILISPSSIKALLAMILEGSKGQSAEQIRHALRIEDDKNSYRMLLNTFLSSLRISNTGYVVELANRMFVSYLVQPKPDYQEALAKYYYSDVRQVDFASPQITATSINDWVNDRTHGFIDKLIKPDNLSPYARMLLVNAIYFKGKWKVPFRTDVTAVRCFYTEDGTCQNAYFMEMLGSFPYAYIKELNSQALELPYEGNKFAMLLLMPNDVKGVNQLLRDLPYSPLHNVISKLVKTDVLVSVPRFKLEYSTDLATTLQTMCIKDIFGPHANLTGMLTSREPTYISNVFQKSKIEVNEEGTTAAAGSGAIAIPLMGNSFPKFHPNRPFFFFIRDLTTGSILFEGRVALPELHDEISTSKSPEHIHQSSQQQPTFNMPVNEHMTPPKIPTFQHSGDGNHFNISNPLLPLEASEQNSTSSYYRKTRTTQDLDAVQFYEN